MPCLIIVDAWKNCEQQDLKDYPFLEKETKAFGSYLNVVLPYIRVKGIDIIHYNSNRPLMDEIETYNDLIVSQISDIPDYDFYYFCGFHLGRCINKKIKELNKPNCGIVYNLSMVFPEDSYYKVIKKYNNNYMYSLSKGFECIDIRT